MHSLNLPNPLAKKGHVHSIFSGVLFIAVVCQGVATVNAPLEGNSTNSANAFRTDAFLLNAVQAIS